MNYAINQIPIFEELKESKSILLAGAGGGFDIFSGIPLYFNRIRDVNTIGEFNGELSAYRNELKEMRGKRRLPI